MSSLSYPCLIGVNYIFKDIGNLNNYYSITKMWSSSYRRRKTSATSEESEEMVIATTGQ